MHQLLDNSEKAASRLRQRITAFLHLSIE